MIGRKADIWLVLVAFFFFCKVVDLIFSWYTEFIELEGGIL